MHLGVQYVFGTVVSFDSGKSRGVIRRDRGGRVYFHLVNVMGGETLALGARVAFRVRARPNGAVDALAVAPYGRASRSRQTAWRGNVPTHGKAPRVYGTRK